MLCRRLSLRRNEHGGQAFEAADAIRSGADEIDMVMNIGELKAGMRMRCAGISRRWCRLARAIRSWVILETCLLSREEIARACMICADAGASFVKTSTGFSTGVRERGGGAADERNA